MNIKWYISNTPEKKVYSNKEVEKYFEDIGIFVSYHEEDIGGGREKGVLTPIKKNMEILNEMEKTPGQGEPINFQIKNSDGELKKVSKEEFARWMEEEKNIKAPPKERLIFGASGDIDSITVFTERKGPGGVFKESYYRVRSEEEKQQIRKRQEINMKRRELEKLQKENSPLVKVENQATRETTDKQTIKPTTSSQTVSLSNSGDQNKNYFGTILLTVSLLSVAGLVVYGISARMKKKRGKR